MARLLLVTVLLALLPAPAAHAGELIDRAAQALSTDNIYVDPDASPALAPAQVERLRDRIDTSRAGRVYVGVMPEEIEREAGGDPGAALEEIAQQVREKGTYVLVSGRTLRAGSTELPGGEAGRLAEEAIDAGGGDLEAILLGLVDRIGDARSGEETAEGGGDGDGGGGGAGAIVLLGLLGAGGAAVYAGRRRRRRAEAAEFEEAKRDARDDLVSLGEGIRALDLDVQMPSADPAARADYERAVEAYTRAEQAWELARTPEDLEPVGAALEEGRWAMASAKARFEDREPPERRPPCFFDPRHGPSSRDVEWSPPFGEPRLVPACEADAQRIERGAEPETREVEWAGRRVPYWQAGSAYAPFAGGYFGGFGGGLLPGLLVGSMLGSAMFPPVVHGDMRDPGGGDFGGDFGGGGFGGGDFGGGGGFGGGDF